MDGSESIHRQADATAAARGGRPGVLEPADVFAVMREQLEFLLEHTRTDCAPGCPACDRLQQVERTLLLPFAC
jgi:hypothetical protein